MLEDKIRRVCGSFSPLFFDVRLDSVEREIGATITAKQHTRDIIRKTNRIYRDYLVMANSSSEATVSLFKVYKHFV